jgi:predicted dehydrogenase
MSKKFRVGVFGVWRGATLARLFQEHEGVTVVAGCDFDPARLDAFTSHFPQAQVFQAYDDLLAEEFEILILASYCPQHGPNAVKALQAGKHVFSEVTAFHTPAEGAALVEAVEKSGCHYMMAENYCYFRDTLEMQRLFREEVLGEFLYGECEYIHDIRKLMTRNADGSYHWRAWLPPFYYNTHSLGPILQITNGRPISVIGQAVENKVAGCPNPIDFGASFVRLDNGGLVRVLVSFSAVREPSSVWYSLYGTKGEVESERWRTQWGLGEVYVYKEDDPLVEYQQRYMPKFIIQREKAVQAGHGGGDFYTVFFFLEALRNGSNPPIDVYRACDFTLPGILAYRSALEGGKSLEIPDFRQPKIREQYRNDHFRYLPPGELHGRE